MSLKEYDSTPSSNPDAFPWTPTDDDENPKITVSVSVDDILITKVNPKVTTDVDVVISIVSRNNPVRSRITVVFISKIANCNIL